MSSFADDPKSRILLAEEDDRTRTFLADNLAADGFSVDQAADFDAAIVQLRELVTDLIVADVNGRTLGLLDTIRRDHSPLAVAADTPVIVLTSQPDDVHRVRVLDRGGDDILRKPFSYPELVARIRAVLRRTQPRQPHAILEAGPVQIDTRRRRVTVARRTVELTAVEYRLACKLASEPTRVFTRAELMRDVWGFITTRSRTLDSHAVRLRAKLANDSHAVVTNVWGVGYRLLDAA